MKHNNKTPPPPTGKAHRLTPKQEKFCLKYVETGNASEAYRQAYNARGMKPETVNRSAFELLENRKISARVAELQKENARLSVVRRGDILSRLKSYFGFDIRNVLSVKDGMITVKDSELWDAETAMCVEAVEAKQDGTIKITTISKQYTINRLCAMCGYDAPAKHQLNFKELSDEEIDIIAQSIANTDTEA